ncbi:unnamed protein product [Amoebophrya sp. A120]|nr:unnamed protein product [Amoebophrya sp. A120]|eukprot:GSA120T00005896001.1
MNNMEGGGSSSSHLHYGAAMALDVKEDVVPEGHTVELRADHMAAKRELFNRERSMITADIQGRRTLQLPTRDEAVRAKLRDYGVPITLFGEGPYERRERLRGIMTGSRDTTESGKVDADGGAPQDDEQRELFLTVGSDLLRERRKGIAKFSFAAAQARLDQEREDEKIRAAREEENEKFCQHVTDTVSIELSQVGDTRPLTQGRFSKDGNVFATSSWTGHIKLWNSPQGTHFRTLHSGVETRAHGVCFANLDNNTALMDTAAAASTTSDNSAGPPQRLHHLAGAMANGSVCVWRSDQELPLCTLKGHEDRVNRVAFHPSGANLVASTSHDQTWRLWDVERQTELLCQEGHSSGVYGLAIHPDGSLLCTTDLGGICRVWDLRTGRTVLPLQGHYEQVLACDFNQRGFLLATASDDNTVRFWDLRKRKCANTLQAHSKCISEVQFDDTGRYFLTSSYDKTVKLWNVDDRHCVKVLVGHEARVMGAAICPAVGQNLSSKGRALSALVASVAFDRTFKFWATNGGYIEDGMDVD